MRPTPAHWRVPTEQPNQRSAMTVRKTSPPEMTAWTSDSGARASAPTWKDPRPEGHEHSEREQLGPEQAHSAANRVAQADVGGRARTAMLQQEAEVRGEGAEKRKENAYFNSHVEGLRIRFGKQCEGKGVDGGGPFPLFEVSAGAPAA